MAILPPCWSGVQCTCSGGVCEHHLLGNKIVVQRHAQMIYELLHSLLHYIRLLKMLYMELLCTSAAMAYGRISISLLSDMVHILMRGYL